MSKIHEKLNIRLPIWSAGMGIGIAGPTLAAGVSNARGLGVLGVGGLAPEEIQSAIVELRRLTSRAFGVNIILPLVQSHEIEMCFDERVPLMVFFWGNVSPYVKDAQRRNILVVAQCGNAEEASAAADAGVDGIIVQGSEAGGHVKATEPLELTLKQTIQTVGSLPVVASGGIATGQDIATGLLAGASAVSMGTRFLATKEARVTEQYKQQIVSGRAEDTLLTELFDIGWRQAQHRVLRNETVAKWEAHGKPAPGKRSGENESVGFITLAAGKTEIPRYTILPPLLNVDADPQDLPLYAGESCERVSDILSVDELMKQLHSELRIAMA